MTKPGAEVNQLIRLSEKMKQIDAEIRILEVKKKELKAKYDEKERDILDSFKILGIEGAKGSLGSANIASDDFPKVENWDEFYKYIKEHNAFELLHRRVSSGAYRERLYDGVEIPGVSNYKKTYLKISNPK